MASVPSQSDRQARLHQLAAEWGIHNSPPLIPITRPLSGPLLQQFRTSNDDFLADELLKRRRLNSGQDKDSQGGLRRAFTTKKKTWEPREVFDALDAHVRNIGSPAIAEALIAKLVSAGGNLNVANAKNRGNSILTRRRSLEVLEPSRILERAIANRQTDMVAVLVQHADHTSLDTALPSAIRSGDVTIVQMMLERGANAAQTAAGQDAFQHICMSGGQADLVALILDSDGKPSPTAVSQAMVDASKKGCLETVQRLSRSTADGNHMNAQALKNAIDQCRVDIALAILTGNRPPSPKSRGLSESFTQLFQHRAVGPNEKLVFAEALLCAGVTPDVVSAALISAVSTEFYPMIDLLVGYGASIEYQDAKVVRDAIRKGQSSMVQLLVTENSTLGPTYASECVEYIPEKVPHEHRHAILETLLRKGANGINLDEALVNAVAEGDANSVHLLLTPQFPEGQVVDGHDGRKGSRGMIYDRHETASVDYQDGFALQIAVKMGNVPIAKQLLAAQPSIETLAQVFPHIHALTPADRYHMTECFLTSGVSEPCVSQALQAAIDEDSSRRDEALINLLLQYNADVNFNDGGTIVSAISHRDVNLLDMVLRGGPRPEVVAQALPHAMAVDDKLGRYRMVALMMPAMAGHHGNEVSIALSELLCVKPVDMQLVDLLMEQGTVDVNFDQSIPVIHAVHDSDPALLDLLLEKGKPTPETLHRALDTLSGMSPSPVKTAKVSAILRRTNTKESLSEMLIKEVRTALNTPAEHRHLGVIKSLLASGADVNEHKAAALCVAVHAADAPISDILLSYQLTPVSLAAALPHALHIQDPMDRLTFTQKLIEHGAPSSEANRALYYAVNTLSEDLPLVMLLAASSDSGDGEALMLAVKQEKSDVAEVLLAKAPRKYGIAVLNNVFQEAVKVKDKEKRMTICTALLKAGTSGPVISDALLVAAANGDIEMGTLLLGYGAKAEHQDGQAIVEACKAGAPDVLDMLLSSKMEVKTQTLAKGFQAATQVGDLKKRGDVFRLLLERGVAGEVVHAQLVSAARFGEEGKDLVKLLLEFGADVNYANGEAVWTATRSAIMGSLRLMLGVDGVGEKQTKPSTLTLLRALKASRKLSKDPRYQVMEWLFEAGLPATEEIHIALNKVVKEEPDLRLIKLLLAHGASPRTNGCETLIDAAQGLAVDVLKVLLEAEVTQLDASWVFKQAFTPDTAPPWISDKGFEVARLLLGKGAEGESLSLALSTAIDHCNSDKDSVARKFVELLIQSKADVNHEDGIVVQKAARAADLELMRQILKQKPNSRSISMAFPYLFDSDLPEDDMMALTTLLTEYHDGEERLDVMFAHPESDPVVFRAVAGYPRSTKIIQALLDAGYYHDQITMAHVLPEVEEEEKVSLLFWALLQPQKRVSSGIIELLIDRGAKINFETELGRTTPLMLAIQSRRPDLVKSLILAGAEVDVTDITGNTPLTMATRIGGDLGTSMMSNILAAEPSRNDGSLHNAARELNLRALKVLVEFGHDLDFPSPLHGGRSALGELCLNAAHAGPLSTAQEKQMEKAMTYLIDQGTDLSLQSDGKSVLLLALHSQDPVTTTRSLLKIGLWKHINKPFNNFTDATYTYSPTQYAARVLPPSDTQAQLLALLTANRGLPIFYAHSPNTTQPEDAVGVPDDLLRADRARRARLDREAREAADHALAISREHELARMHSQIFVARAELEDARARRRRDDEADALRDRAVVEDELFAARMARARIEREAAVAHERALAEEGLARARMLGEADEEVEERKRERMISFERTMGEERVGNAKALAAVRVEERGEVERMDRLRDERVVGRIERQRLLVDSQERLAANLASAGAGGRRQIGYIAGELD